MEHGLKYIAFYIQKRITPCQVVITFLQVRAKPLGVPASVKRIYCSRIILLQEYAWCDRWLLASGKRVYCSRIIFLKEYVWCDRWLSLWRTSGFDTGLIYVVAFWWCHVLNVVSLSVSLGGIVKKQISLAMSRKNIVIWIWLHCGESRSEMRFQ